MDLFWTKQHAFKKNIQCYCFGHALVEKALAPYIGRTGHAILLKGSSDFFTKDYSEQLQEIDQIISDAWFNKIPNKKIDSPKKLQPFPLLGIPGWWDKRQDESFYLNEEYFRRKNRAKASS